MDRNVSERDASVLPSVTLIVPVLNEEAHLETCLDAIAAQTYPEKLLEVVVVDGLSDDRTLEIALQRQSRDDRFRVMSNPKRSMPNGLNLGIVEAKGQVIGVVSGHSAIPPSYVATAVETLEQTGAWAVGGRIVRVAHTPRQQAIAAATASPFGVGDARHNFIETAGEVEAVFPGVWPAWVFDRVGLFDPAMALNEDNEFSYRIRQAGGLIWLNPAIAVEYSPRDSLRALFRQYFLYGFGKVAVIAKHPRSLRWRFLIPPAWVMFLGIGGPAALAIRALRALYVAGIAAYLATTAIGAVQLRSTGASASRTWTALATMHLAYGVGFWRGVLPVVAGLLGRLRQ